MAYLISLGFILGELFKIPFFNFGGATILDLILIVLVFWAFLQKKLTFKKLPLFLKAGFGFASIGLISLVFSPLQLKPLELLISISYILRFAIFLLASYFVFLNFFQLKKNTPKTLLFSGVIISLLGILQIIFIPNLGFLANQGWDPHIYRTVSTFLDPNFVGAFFVLTLIILLLKLVKLPQKWFLTFFILVFIALITTFSRGAYLAFSLSFLTMALIKKSIKLFILTLILLLILAGSFFIYQHMVTLPQKVDRGQSAQQRLGSWQQGFLIFEKNPILGVGFNSYRFALREYQLASTDQINSHGGASNDSAFLFVVSTTGVIGMSVYLLFLFLIFKTAWKNWRAKNIWGLVVISALIGLIGQSFFANTLFYPALLGWLMLSTSQLSDNN